MDRRRGSCEYGSYILSIPKFPGSRAVSMVLRPIKIQHFNVFTPSLEMSCVCAEEEVFLQGRRRRGTKRCVVVINRSCVSDRTYFLFSRNSAALDFQSCLGSMWKCWYVFLFSLSHAPREARDVRFCCLVGSAPQWCFGRCFWKLDLLAKVNTTSRRIRAFSNRC